MRCSTLARWASPAAAALAICSPALAQEATDQPFGVKISLAEAYDDNISRSSAALSAQRGLHPSDEIFSPFVLLDLQRTFGRETGYLNGSTGYDVYAQNPTLNRERIDLNGGLSTQAGLCTGGVSGNVGRHQSDLTDVTQVQQNGVLIQRGVVKNIQDSDTYGLNLSCGHPIGFSPFVSVSHADASNTDIFQRQTDHSTFSVTGGLTYQRPSLGALSVYGEYDTTDYPHQLVLNLRTGRVSSNKYATSSGGLRYVRSIGARLQGQVSVGYTSVSPSLAGGPSFSGITYAADLGYRVSSKLGAHVSLTHSARPSNLLDSSFSVTDLYQIDGTYALGSRIKLNLGYAWSKQHEQGQLLNPAIDLINETSNRVFGGASVSVFRRVSLGLDVQYEERDANLSVFSYGDTRVSLSAVTHF